MDGAGAAGPAETRCGHQTNSTVHWTGPHHSAAIYNSAVSRKQLPIHSVTPSVSNIHP